jgi:hypothetical protein
MSGLLTGGSFKGGRFSEKSWRRSPRYTDSLRPVKQLTFVEPGKLEWQEVAPPTLEG